MKLSMVKEILPAGCIVAFFLMGSAHAKKKNTSVRYDYEK